MEDILAKLVSFQPVTGSAQASHELVEYVARFVSRRGMHVERYVSNGFESLVATTKPGDKTPTVMLAAHGDVVDAPEEEFAIRKEGDRIYGRGVKDMLFALAGFLQIVDDLGGDLLSHSLGLMLTTDEENGGFNGVNVLVQEGYRPKVVILPDGGENWQVQTDCKGVYMPQITAIGAACHSSRHWEGDNALERLLTVIPRLHALFPDEQGPDTNTISVNIINAGYSLSRVPDRATLTADIRTLDFNEHQRIKIAVASICEELGLELDANAEGLPTHFDLADPMIAPYVRLMESTIGIRIHGSKTLASNDARFMAPYGIPCISFYPPGEGHHSSNEWISAQGFQQFHDITLEYVRQMAR